MKTTLPELPRPRPHEAGHVSATKVEVHSVGNGQLTGRAEIAYPLQPLGCGRSNLGDMEGQSLLQATGYGQAHPEEASSDAAA